MNKMYRMLFCRLMEPSDVDGGPGAGPAPVGDTTPSGDDNLFADIATHDEMAPSTPEPATAPEPVVPAATPPVSPPAGSVSPPAGPAGTPPGSPSPAAPPVQPAAPAAIPPGAPAADGSQQPAASGDTPPAGSQTPQVPFDLAKHREEFLPKLAEHYKLDEADVEAARTDPGKVLPTLAARVHYDVQHAVFSGVMTALPQMMAQYFEQQKANEKNEEEFFTAFPTLKEKPEYAQTVMQSITAIRTANPQITRPELIKQAGIMASLSLGLPLPGATPPAPAAPAAPVPATRPIVAAARPAGAGTVGHVPAPLPPGSGDAQSDLDALVAAHLAGEI